MKFKQFFGKGWLAAYALVALVAVVAHAATVTNGTNVSNLVIDGTGIYDSNGTLRWAPGSTNAFTGDTSIAAPADIYFGSSSTVVSTTTTSGSSQGLIFTAYLLDSNVSVNALEGSVLCSTTSKVGQGVTVVVCGSGGAMTNLNTFAGVAAAAASTGSVVNVYTNGWVLALTTGTVNPGDPLSTSSISAGYLSNSVFTVGTATNTVATALGSGNANGGTTKVRLR